MAKPTPMTCMTCDEEADAGGSIRGWAHDTRQEALLTFAMPE